VRPSIRERQKLLRNGYVRVLCSHGGLRTRGPGSFGLSHRVGFGLESRAHQLVEESRGQKSPALGQSPIRDGFAGQRRRRPQRRSRT
jgi:hypothetical protein